MTGGINYYRGRDALNNRQKKQEVLSSVVLPCLLP